MAEDDVDFAVAAYHDDGRWHLAELHPTIGEDLEELREALGRFPSDVGVLGLVSMRDDFFVIVRRSGTQVRAMLSDVTAVDDWPIAGAVVELLDVVDLGDDDDPLAIGDLALLSDLGMSAADLSVLCEDGELYPEDILMDVADRLGFGTQLGAIIG